jgi:hypothetical protein
MNQSNEASLPGSSQSYRVHPQAKRYTMRDNSFMETKKGNFQYERVLSNNIGSKSAPHLKVSVSKDFSKLKISTVTANGMRKIDLYANEEMAEERKMAEFFLETFVQEDVLEKV